MIELSFKAAKEGFFDRRSVIRALGEANVRVLSAQGQEVQYQAKGLLWPGKGPSAPGRPPHMHTGLIKKFLYFSYDVATKSEVIGPAIINTPTGAPKTLEYGGDAQFPENRWATVGGQRKLVSKYKIIHVLPRPYMKPALALAKPRLAELWQNSVR